MSGAGPACAPVVFAAPAPVYLAASACVSDPAAVQRAAPELWRRVRRYNLPVQLALAAAEQAAARARDVARAALISVAPYRSGSLELWSWARGHVGRADLRGVRLNPIHTLHAVDNLALSAFALAHGNQGYCLGVGGAPGQAWCAIEAALERVGAGYDDEALLMAGDHDPGHERGLGVALLFSARPAVYAPLGRALRLTALSRAPARHDDGPPEAAARDLPESLRPHSAAGLAALLEALARLRGPRLAYAVPERDSDGGDRIELLLECGHAG